jgi:hypothetical protein
MLHRLDLRRSGSHNLVRRLPTHTEAIRIRTRAT